MDYGAGNMSESKPFYKKKSFLFILIGIIIVFYFIGTMTQEGQTEDDKPEENEKTEEGTEIEGQESENPDDIKIELNEEFNAMYYNARVTDVVLSDGEIRLWFGWTNKSEWDPSHFAMHGEVQVSQDGEMLEEIGGTERKHKQINLKEDDYYKVDYKLISDSDVEISVIPFDKLDEDEEDKVITIEID